jgi:large subunit ribosomal protein L15
MITLHTLSPSQDRHHPKRLGRGNSSGKGTTAGRGTKGQRARTGGRNKTTRRALKALIERTPKTRGFRSRTPKLHAVTVAQLSARGKEGQVITAAVLAQMNMIPGTRAGLKIIGTADLKKKLTVKANAFSKSAHDAIVKAGGSAVILKSAN